jgi:hypothetical protein
VPFTDEEAVEMALRNGFEPRYRHGAGTQEFWLWYFKRSRARQWAIYTARRVRRRFRAIAARRASATASDSRSA